MDEFDSFINNMDTGAQDTSDADDTGSTEAETTEEQTNTGTEDTSTEEVIKTEPEAQPKTSTAKRKNTANDAFAELRVKNKTAQNALELICAQAGIDPAYARKPEELIALIEDVNTQATAQQTGMDAEVLKRLNKLEKQEQQRASESLSNKAVAQFKAVQDKYNLTEDELVAFSKQLKDSGVNPFEKEVDLEKEYCFKNLPAILAKERAAGQQELLDRNAKAEKHSSKPSSTASKSSPVDTGSKIDTMAKFDRFLSTINQ